MRPGSACAARRLGGRDQLAALGLDRDLGQRLGRRALEDLAGGDVEAAAVAGAVALCLSTSARTQPAWVHLALKH